MSTQTLSAPPVPRAALSPRRWKVLRILLGLQVIALAAMYLSGHWDAAEHARGAVDSFWYPPHYGIYFGILAAALLSGAGLLLLVWGSPVSPFRALAQNPALSMVVIANLLGFTGAPADALWHEVFGIDLTVWSPPHLHILLGEMLAALACVVYFLAPPRPGDELFAPLRTQSLVRTLSIVAVFVLALLISAFLFLEYEAGVRSREVLARPRWAFPVLWTWFLAFTFAVVSAATRRAGMATAVALAYDLARLLALAFDRTVLDYEGSIAFPLLLAALPWDITLFVLLRRHRNAVVTQLAARRCRHGSCGDDHDAAVFRGAWRRAGADGDAMDAVLAACIRRRRGRRRYGLVGRQRAAWASSPRRSRGAPRRRQGDELRLSTGSASVKRMMWRDVAAGMLRT